MDKEDIESLGWDFKEEYVNIDTHIVYEKDNGDLLVFLEKYHHIQMGYQKQLKLYRLQFVHTVSCLVD